MPDGPVLETVRLTLRLPSAADLDDWASMGTDVETMRHIGGVTTRPEAWRQLCTMRGAWDITGYAMFSVIERATGRWIGRIGPWEPDGWPGKEVGWGIAAEFAGKGYAFEAAVASMHYVFDVLGWAHVIHTIAPDNVRSVALARRLGSVNQGPVSLPAPHQAVRVDAWGQSATDWSARRASLDG